MIHMWRDLPIIVAAPAQTLFVLLYTLRPLGAGQWWGDFVGRALAFKSATLMLVIDFAVLGYLSSWLEGAQVTWRSDAHGLDLAVVIGYWLVAAAIYYQLVALVYERWHPRGTARRSV